MKSFPLIHFGISVENPVIDLLTPLPHNVPIHFKETYLNDYWVAVMVPLYFVF